MKLQQLVLMLGVSAFCATASADWMDGFNSGSGAAQGAGNASGQGIGSADAQGAGQGDISGWGSGKGDADGEVDFQLKFKGKGRTDMDAKTSMDAESSGAARSATDIAGGEDISGNTVMSGQSSSDDGYTWGVMPQPTQPVWGGSQPAAMGYGYAPQYPRMNYGYPPFGYAPPMFYPPMPAASYGIPAPPAPMVPVGPGN